jgi:tetratricopeptide (TPR) repeat protein
LRRSGRRLLYATVLSVAVATSTVPVTASAAGDFGDPRAETLYNAGIEKFDDGLYEDALADLEASLELERNPSTLYAYAQSLYKLERCREAVPVYKEVLSMLPDGSGARPTVKDALVKCAEKMAEESDVAPPPPTVEDPPEETESVEAGPDVVEQEDARPGKPWYADPYAPILIGVGAVGVGLGGWYLSEADKENAKMPDQYDDFAAKGDRVRSLQIRGGVILGIGGALVLTGAIRYAVLGIRGRRSTTAFSPALGPRSAGVTFSGRF